MDSRATFTADGLSSTCLACSVLRAVRRRGRPACPNPPRRRAGSSRLPRSPILVKNADGPIPPPATTAIEATAAMPATLARPARRATVIRTEPRVRRRLDAATLTASIVAVGLAWRLVRYLADWPLWGDEAFLAVSVMTRDFLGLTKPLEYHQIAPVGFLWIELAVIRLLGASEWALRLVPFLAGVGSLLLFWRLATRTLRLVQRCWPWGSSRRRSTRSGTLPRPSRTRLTSSSPSSASFWPGR